MFKTIIEGQSPSDNHLYSYCTMGKSKRMIKFMTKRGKEYKKKVQSLAMGHTPTDEAIIMNIHLFFGDKRKRDLHGCLKVLIDSFEGLIYNNDSQIIELNLKKSYDKNNPRAEVEINTVGELYGYSEND